MKPKRTKRPSVQSQIESWPRIRELEMAWGKNAGGDLVGLARDRKKYCHLAKTEDVLRYDYHIHSHAKRLSIDSILVSIFSKVIFDLKPVASKGDIQQQALRKSFALKEGTKKARSSIISIIDRGKEIGRIHIHIPNESLEKMYRDSLRSNSFFLTKKEYEAFIEKYKIRTRFVSREGYRFDRKKYNFVKAKR